MASSSAEAAGIDGGGNVLPKANSSGAHAVDEDEDTVRPGGRASRTRRR
eukprot:CAMPEP_0119508088 /NCGR_PEP_ID=MMETSP1344-20130328/27800_1 /TAXON_ID=236787 /ORGANISM="Florenciella parvula, Strain CCMP2471" /LENGTH=48 /DNA_ID= /DNA_START= /DNA_END= /DNA_ORIENTATION=